MDDEESIVDEFPEEEEFDDDTDELGEEYQDDSDDEDAEELFRQNPLKAIFIRLGEVKELLEDD